MGMCVFEIMRKKYIFVIIIFIIISFLGCNDSNRYFCIHDDSIDREGLKLSFMPEENCYGYVLAQSDSVDYLTYNSDKEAWVEVLVKNNNESWLKGRTIFLHEDKSAIYYREHFSNLRNIYGRGRNETFNDYLGLKGYLKIVPLSDARILHLFDLDEETELPLYVSCIFWNRDDDLSRVQCAVSFAYNSIVSVRVTVGYSDLKNAKSKAVEIKSFIDNLII